jgi:hypothetical protein
MFSHLFASVNDGSTTNTRWTDSAELVDPHNGLFLSDEDMMLMAETFSEEDSNGSISSISSTSSSPSAISVSPQNILTQSYQPQPTVVVPPMFNFQLQQQNFLSVIQQKQEEKRSPPPQQQQQQEDKSKNGDTPNPRKRSRREIESDKQELDDLLSVPEKERTESQKKLILKLRNRQTAKRSRDRKKQEFDTTMEENRKLTVINKQLVEEIKQLKAENQHLKLTIDQLTTRTSPDSYISLTISEEHEREPDIDSFLSHEYRNNNTSNINPSSNKSFQFSPLFNFSNNENGSPQKKSKMFMLVFFVAAICCFFLGTTLVNEIPANALMHKAKVHNNEMRNLNPSTVAQQKKIVRSGMTFSGPGPGFPYEIAIPLRESVMNIRANSQQEQQVRSSASVLRPSQYNDDSKMKNGINVLPFEVQINPNIADFVQEQFKESEIPVLIRVHIGPHPSYIFTSVSNTLSQADQAKVISAFQATVTQHFQLMCKISDKPFHM